MKKTFTLFLLALCGASGLFAQAPPPSAKAIFELMRKHTAAFGPAYEPASVLKGAAAGERVSSEGDYADNTGNGNIEFTDSARYIYSSARHSSFDYNGFQYINLSSLDQGTNPDFLFMEPRPNNVDSSNLPIVFFDTLHHYAPDPTTGNVYRRHTEIGTFNADTSFSTINNRALTPSGNLDFGLREVVLYNAGRIAKVYAIQYYSGGAPEDTMNVRSITYNSAGNVLIDSLAQDNGGGMMPVLRNDYIYNAAGLYTTHTQLLYNGSSGTYDTGSRTTNTYYSNGQLRTSAFELPGGMNGFLMPLYKDSMTYTAGVPGYTGLYEDNYDDTGAIVFSYKFITNRITAGKKDSITLYVSFMGFEQEVISLKLKFNAAGNPVSGTQYDLQNGIPGNVIAYRNWYYEPITTSGPGAGVPRVSMASVSISPNPTNGIITLNYANTIAGTPVKIRVTNMAGQLVHTESLLLQGARQQIVLGNEAVPGQYLISVQDAGGNVLCSSKIVKE